MLPSAQPLHPQLRAMLDKAVGLPPMHTLSVEQVRAGDLARYTTNVPRIDVHKVEDTHCPGLAGEIALRIYRPSDERDLPGIVFFHGSGFVICSLDTHDALCRQLCHASHCVVISVDYRLAPEHRFPAAPDDCLAALRWVHANAQSLGIDSERLAVAGDSAGGNLAAVTTLRCRDEGGPSLRAQLLMYPVTDYHSPGTASYEERAAGFGLGRDGMRWFWGHYLASGDQASNALACPLRAERLDALPAAYVMTAEYDPLRDEGLAYARRLQEAGVPVTTQHYADMNHGFMFWVGLIDVSTHALEAAAAWLRLQLEHLPDNAVSG